MLTLLKLPPDIKTSVWLAQMPSATSFIYKKVIWNSGSSGRNTIFWVPWWVFDRSGRKMIIDTSIIKRFQYKIGLVYNQTRKRREKSWKLNAVFSSWWFSWFHPQLQPARLCLKVELVTRWRLSLPYIIRNLASSRKPAKSSFLAVKANWGLWTLLPILCRQQFVQNHWTIPRILPCLSRLTSMTLWALINFLISMWGKR